MELKLDDKQLETLKALGANYFTMKQCAIVLEVDLAEFINHMKRPSSAIYKTYYSGYLLSLLKLRQSIADLALRGSGPAQLQLIKIIEATEKANL